MKQLFTLKKFGKASVIALACFGLTACYQTIPSDMSMAELSQPAFKNNHPIIVKQGQQQVNLVVPAQAGGLSSVQTAVAAQFILDYIDKGEGLFQIWQPNGNSNTKAVAAAHKKVRQILYDAAIPANAISYHKYDAFGDDKAWLGLKFKRYYASVAKCGAGNQNLGTNYLNKNYQTFGCAYQNNLAAMISNPKDLISPSALSAASAERRQIIWSKYIAGVATGAAKSSDESATISEVAQ
ncbi:MAG: CpaD family pilus assembly protein [Rhizobiales bacterium]|nr:CpaD family pilus assembly protein [Hyphomicrobiales bacterium]NRB14267.1 CpaD family pilus assembly protein [Hyphomicrobiales bacterium]